MTDNKSTLANAGQLSLSLWLNPSSQTEAAGIGESGEENVMTGIPLVKPFKFASAPHEYKVVSLRECPLPEEMTMCDTPDRAADYWRKVVATSPAFNPECECLVVLMLNTRRKVKGHSVISIGTQDTILVHPREVFRLAIVAAAAAIVIMHNHPSGEPDPSEADIKVTRDLIRAGQLLKIDVLDHVIMGNPKHSSLRELGYFNC